MRFEIIVFVIAAFLMANIYTDGKYWKTLVSWKKYYQVAGIVFGGLALYWILKKAPAKNRNQLLASTSEYIKYMPIDRESSSWLNPILDFTTKQNFNLDQHNYPYNHENHPIIPLQSMNQYERKVMNSGLEGGNVVTGKTKRSVSETKKKFVAARQGWKCGDCQEQLNAWFEVDHKTRLEYGGSNHVDNLVALCRDCHGKKTTIENL
jgi:hypothetical protein